MFGIGPYNHHKKEVPAHHSSVHDENFGVSPELLAYTPCPVQHSAPVAHLTGPHEDVFGHEKESKFPSPAKLLGLGLLGATALFCHKKVNDLNFFLRNGIKAAGAAAVGVYLYCMAFKE